MAQSEQILADKIQQGDVESMAEYLNVRRRDMLAVILSKMGPALKNKVEAEHVFQEVSQTAVENFRAVTFTERGPFGWLCELVDRRIIDIPRRFSAQKRDAAKEIGIHGSPDQSQIGLVSLLVASITSPSRAFSRKQKEFQLLTAMDRLSMEQTDGDVAQNG